MIRDSAITREEKLVIIDFEYCSYNYRGFDVANHFCESMYDYTFDKYPKFNYNPAAMPSVEQQVMFLNLSVMIGLDVKCIDSIKILFLSIFCSCILFVTIWRRCSAKWASMIPIRIQLWMLWMRDPRMNSDFYEKPTVICLHRIFSGAFGPSLMHQFLPSHSAIG